MTISTNVEKVFDKIPHPFMIKSLRKIREGDILHLIKNVTKTSFNITVNDKRLNVFPLRSGTRHGCLLWWLIQHSAGGSVQHSKARKGKKRHTNIKGKNKAISIYRWHDCLHRISQGDYKRTRTKGVHKYHRLQEKDEILWSFLYISNEHVNTKIKNPMPSSHLIY